MLKQKSILEQAGEKVSGAVQSVKNATSSVGNNLTNAAQSATNSLTNVKNNINNNLKGFNPQNFVNGSKEFFSSNSLLAKFSFIILVLILFMIIFRVMVYLMQYFFSPRLNPYVVWGSLTGNDKVILPQDPSKSDSVQILKSNNRHGGAEFTWSVWLFLNPPSTTSGKLRNVFVKGNPNFGDDGVNIVNGPGMYLNENPSGSGAQYDLQVHMDTINPGVKDTVIVESIPIRKWVHVAIRLNNMMLDVYVNGVVAKRQNLKAAPKQNFYDVVVNGNEGFNGKLSNLRYYSYALNVFELNNIVLWGPSTHTSSLSSDSRANSGTYSYLSSQWYTNNY
jgi:hypothetical protein